MSARAKRRLAGAEIARQRDEIAGLQLARPDQRAKRSVAASSGRVRSSAVAPSHPAICLGSMPLGQIRSPCGVLSGELPRHGGAVGTRHSGRADHSARPASACRRAGRCRSPSCPAPAPRSKLDSGRHAARRRSARSTGRGRRRDGGCRACGSRSGRRPARCTSGGMPRPSSCTSNITSPPRLRARDRDGLARRARSRPRWTAG